MIVNKSFMTNYMREVFNYGGIPTTRVDIIVDLSNKGSTMRMIGAYLMGLELSRDMKVLSNSSVSTHKEGNND